MGLDLTLVPKRYSARLTGWFLGYDRIGLDRDYALFDWVRGFTSQPLPESTRFDWYGDGGLIQCTTDAYSEPLRVIDAGNFHLPFDVEELSDWNQAALAMMRKLPRSTHVLLWWH